MAELKKKLSVRKGHISHVKRLITEYNDIKGLDKERIDKNKLKTIKLTVQAKQSVIANLSDEIWSLYEEENQLEKDMDDMNDLTDSIDYFVTSITEFISCFEKDDRAESVLSTATTVTENRVKLPKIEIKRFDGDELNWRPFWDQFQSTINKNETLTDIDKFCYLRNLLNEKALECIKGLSLTEGNYATALKLLDERYGNKQVLVSRYMDVFVKIEKVKSLNDVARLRKLYDSVEMSLRNLTELGVETGTYGTLLINILFDRLPDGLKIIIVLYTLFL